MKKENISDLLSKADQKLLKSVKDEFGKLSSVDQKKIIDSTNSIMDSLCDVLGVENKYKLTEDMFTDCKDKCKDIKSKLKDKKEDLKDLASDTLSKLGISDEFIKNWKIDGDKIYIDVQVPIEDDTVADIDLNVDDKGVSYDNLYEDINKDNEPEYDKAVKQGNIKEEEHPEYFDTINEDVNVPKYTRKNKVKDKKSRKIKFKNNLNMQQVKSVVEQEQVKPSVLDRLKSEAKPVEKKKEIDWNEIKNILLDKICAILEDENTHDYVVYPREGNIPASVQVDLHEVCSCVINNYKILDDIAEALKDKYDFPDVYIHATEVKESYDKDASVTLSVVMTLED